MVALATGGARSTLVPPHPVSPEEPAITTVTTDPDAREASDPESSGSRGERARRRLRGAIDRNLDNVHRPDGEKDTVPTVGAETERSLDLVICCASHRGRDGWPKVEQVLIDRFGGDPRCCRASGDEAP